MTNFEKYKEQIKDYPCFAITASGTLYPCCDISCSECIFKSENDSCIMNRCKWITEEYKEPKSKGEHMFEELGFIRGISFGYTVETWVRGGVMVIFYESGSVYSSTLETNVIEAIVQRGKELFNE